jgi:hypothetical protein
MPTIRIVVSDPYLRGYLEDCLSRIADVALAVDDVVRADLVVTDLDFGDAAVAEVRSLHVLDEAPGPGSELSSPIDFILMPFDARSLAHAVSRALQRGRQLP